MPVLHVFTYDLAGVSEDALAAAREEAGRILRAAGAALQWLDCRQANAAGASSSACRGPLAPSHVVVRILPQRRQEYRRLPSGIAAVSEILGHALTVRDTGGNYISIFEKSVLRTAAGSAKRLPLLLAYSIAHEIGHLLLGPEHTTGIMARDWAARDVLVVPPEQLLFSVSDSRKLVERARLRTAAGRYTLK